MGLFDFFKKSEGSPQEKEALESGLEKTFSYRVAAISFILENNLSNLKSTTIGNKISRAIKNNIPFGKHPETQEELYWLKL